jgi:D-xylose transport system ATP-binding protein
MNATLLNAEPEAPLPLLSVAGLNVSFGPVRRLSDVELTVGRGELVALAGEPGAGKTALVRCIAGDLAPTEGEILLDGRPVPTDPAAAGRLGISVVWQDLALCDNLDVAGNVLLGQETPRLMFAPDRLHAEAGSLLGRLQIPIPDTTRLVGTLSGGQRRLVAVAKAIRHEPRLLVLDEPTAALGVAQTAQVLALIKRLRERGLGVVVISHNLSDVFEVTDRIFVLRLGRREATFDTAQASNEEVVAAITGARHRQTTNGEQVGGGR